MTHASDTWFVPFLFYHIPPGFALVFQACIIVPGTQLGLATGEHARRLPAAAVEAGARVARQFTTGP